MKVSTSREEFNLIKMNRKEKIVLDICHDCACMEGELHEDGCDHEHCSKCGRQVLGWGKCKGAKPEPFFSIRPSRCERCDRAIEWNEDMKMVSNEEWKFICGVTYDLKCVLCPKCMDWIAKVRRTIK